MGVTEWTGREARLLRKATRMSVRAFAAKLGISPRTVSKWEELGTGRTPLPEYQAILDTTLAQATPEALDLFHALLAEGADRPIRAVEVATSTATSLVDLTTSTTAPDVGDLIDAAGHRAHCFLMQAFYKVVDGESMDHLWTETAQLASDYQRQPPHVYASRLVEIQNTCFDLLERPASITVTRQLLTVSAITGGILAKVALDLGHQRSAQTHIRAAYVSADHADHPQLKAWIRGLQSVMAYWEGRYAEARDYAARGQALQARSTASVWLAASDARAAAAVGDVPATRAALTAADEARADLIGNEIDDLGGLCVFSPARQIYYAADALAALPGQVREAGMRAEAAVEAYRDREADEWAFGDAAGSSAALALVHVRDHDVPAAADQLASVLELPADQRIEGVVKSVGRVYGELKNVPDTPAVRQLRVDVEDFTRVTAESVAL